MRFAMVAVVVFMIVICSAGFAYSLSFSNSGSPTTSWHTTTFTNTTTMTSETQTNSSILLQFSKDGALCTANQSQILSKMNIAVIEPVFTASAYQPNGFYTAYDILGSSHSTLAQKQAALSDFKVRLVNSWGFSYAIDYFLTSSAAKQCGLVPGKNVHVLSDIDVSNGALFYPNGTAKYTAVIVAFDEYDTASEYASFEQYVSNGGHLVLMDACNFLAEVKYNSTSDIVTFVEGHGWQYNGTAAWTSVPARWIANNTNWVGGNFCCFKSVRYSGASVSNQSLIGQALSRRFGKVIFKTYMDHEENQVNNRTGTQIIATFIQSPQSQWLVASYIHVYHSGTVIHIGFMSDDIFGSDRATQAFLILSLLYSSGAS